VGGSERRRDERVEVRTDEREREREREKDCGRWKENRRRRSSVDDDEFVPPNASFFTSLRVRFSFASMLQRVFLNRESRRRELEGMRAT
jgi:hypothetical protein